MSAALGLDLGGTYTKCVLAEPSGRVLARGAFATLPELGPADYARRAAEFARGLEARAGRKAASAGVGAAGDVDHEAGRIRFAPNLRSFRAYPLRAALSRALKRRVTLHNDANMAAWGAWALHGRPKSALLVTLGTGVGGGLVLGGELHLGATGSAGELGHVAIRPGGAPCHCGKRGCLEAYAGGYGVLRLARGFCRSPRGRRSELLRLRAPWTPEDVCRAARRGDWAARRAWAAAGEALAQGLAGFVYLLNPEVLFLSGGLAGAAPFFLGEVRRGFAREPFKAPFKRLKLKVLRDPYLGAAGAALFASRR